MSKARKIIAWLLTAIMVLGMCTTVFAAGLTITKQPANVSTADGDTIAFEVAVTPADNVAYQWQKGVPQKTKDTYTWTNIEGATQARFEHKVDKDDLNGIVYRCEVKRNGEIVYSANAGIIDVRTPNILGVTETSVQFEKRSSENYALECAVKGQNNWTSDGIIDGLEPGKSYEIVGRLRYLKTRNVSEPGIAKTVKTKEKAVVKPQNPVLAANDSTSITVVTVKGQEYAIYTGSALPANAEWKSAENNLTFADLLPETEYRIVSRIAASGSQPAGELSEVLVVKTAAAPRTQPDVPKLVARTDTVLEVETLEGQEYRINQKEWQSSGRFEGLSPDTEYVIETRLIPREGEGDLISDPLIARTMKAAPDAPAKPELKSSTTDTIEVNAADGLEYAICEGKAAADQQWNWQSSSVFGGLKPGTEYSIVARAAATENQMAGKTSMPLVVSTQKKEAAAPGRPELSSNSDTRIEVIAVSNQVYAIYTGNTMPENLSWQSNGIFEKLNPNTEYKIVTKISETADQKESPVSEPLVVTTQKSTPAAPDTPKLKDRSQTMIEVEAKSGLEYSIDGGKTWQTSGKFQKLNAETAYEIIARVKETNTAVASAASQPLKVSTLRNVINTKTSENKITGIKNGQVIKLHKSVTFTAVGGGMDIKDPIDGDVRYVPTEWEGLSDGTWKKAPYKATVKATKTGTYTIKVTFDRQVYENGKWVSDGKDDTKSITLKATTTGESTTAPKTGDETQIVLYVILLIAAAGVAGISVVAMRKQKKA